jgi:hypothetical protein
MGDLTSCNYCTLQFYKRKYGKKNIRTRLSKKEGMERWIAVVLRGKGEIGWFMELTDNCAC